MYRVRARDFDLTVRRRFDLDRDGTLKRRGREDAYRTIKLAVDVEKAFAEQPTEPVVAADGPSASDEDWSEIEIEVDLSELYPDGSARR
jgi:hypothetical protein